MIYKTLSNGVKMPMIGFGTYQVTNEAECQETVYQAIKCGYRLIDTAQAYGNEAAVGRGIAQAISEGIVTREELFITTKVWFRSFETRDCRLSIEQSLEKLGTDYLDLVLLHWPYGNVYSAWRVLEEFYEQKKIRAIGVSNMESDRLIDLITFNTIRPMVNQIETHLYCQRQSEKEWLNKYQVAHQAYSPLGQGRANEMFSEAVVKTLATKYGKTPAQILLRFLLQSDVAIIPKTTHVDRMKENIAILDFELSNEEMSTLRDLDRKIALIGNSESPELTEFAMTW